MSPLEELLSPEMPYAVRYAAAATRGLSVPAPSGDPIRWAPWTPELDAKLLERYDAYRRDGRLSVLAQELGRTYGGLMERARVLGLRRKRS